METDILYVACSNKMYEQGIKERKGKKKEEKEKTEKGQKEGKGKNGNRKNTWLAECSSSLIAVYLLNGFPIVLRFICVQARDCILEGSSV